MKARPYQAKALADLDAGWTRGDHCQILRIPTGGGKSFTAAAAVRDNIGGALMMAHRGELVAQLSTALAREGIRHRIIGPDTLARACMQAHLDEMDTHYVSSGSNVGVASVQSLASLKGEDAFLRQVTMAVPDEFHHYIRENAYGKALCMLRSDARVLGPTATPGRPDGKGLGRWADGFADSMVDGPQESWLMRNGVLCKYRIFCPPTSFHREDLTAGASGEFVADTVKKETRRSTVFGDCVDHHMSQCRGDRTLVFCDSIENATLLCQKFREAGVTAELITGKTESGLRRRMLRDFVARRIEVLLNVSLIDEGFDCPGIETIHDLRATKSIIRFRQGFGRGWRVDGDKILKYFDYVNNIDPERGGHGLPDAYRDWSEGLDRRERRSKSTPSDEVPIRVCAQCASAYERALPGCPYCGVSPVPARRDGPEFVDGKLGELDEATLARMRGAVVEVDSAWVAVPQGAGHVIAQGIRNRHAARQTAQMALRRTVELWGGWAMLEHQCQLPEAQSRFYSRFHIDTLSAAALPTAEAIALEQRVRASLPHGIIAAPVN